MRTIIKSKMIHNILIYSEVLSNLSKSTSVCCLRPFEGLLFHQLSYALSPVGAIICVYQYISHCSSSMVITCDSYTWHTPHIMTHALFNIEGWAINKTHCSIAWPTLTIIYILVNIIYYYNITKTYYYYFYYIDLFLILYSQ